MNNLCSEVIKCPVSISTVVICDIKVLIKKGELSWVFPNDFLKEVDKTVQDCASRIIEEVIGEKIESKKWIPIDIRSDKNRINFNSKKFSLDIGYFNLLDFHDIPLVDCSKYKWVEVDLETGRFPLKLEPDHDDLWCSCFNVLNLLIK